MKTPTFYDMIPEPGSEGVPRGKMAQTRNATIVKLSLPGLEGSFDVIGEARRHPVDAPDPEVGRLLALSRAYAKAAKRLEHRALGLIKHHDDVRQFTHKPYNEWLDEQELGGTQ